eukprot:CAMPEP_0180820730 /NCGR_PEP_ID=MMETSP1038_2-20121128/70441_1 /TAXON_ID=632150 /ORGANISM="Azadinium spinosum, Strain 3D9" /LENGTH=73 /DNA_ID=CAMNT_0022862841 /DNA_START=44 /DNA_END=261 /DNA_ORIENTATION=-
MAVGAVSKAKLIFAELQWSREMRDATASTARELAGCSAGASQAAPLSKASPMKLGVGTLNVQVSADALATHHH